jgi:ERCC4 domain
VNELLIATNPDSGSTLAYLLRVPLGDGMVLRTSGTWPRTKALYCYPVPADEWPADADIIERVPLRSCTRRGAAVEIVADRARENRSQLVFTSARGRDAVFWQSPRTRKQARPSVALPTARAAGIAELEIVVDAHERYAYRFAGQQVQTTSRALPCGDYGLMVDGDLVAAVERKSMPDLVSSLINGRLRYALGELAALPRAAVVVEDRYSQVFKQDRFRPALVADAIAECQVRWPNIPIVFCETRGLAEEWTYRYLAAAQAWAVAEPAAIERIGAWPTAEEVEEVAARQVASGTAGTGTPETGTPETGTPETGTPETGTPETGTPETGTPGTNSRLGATSG